jgi:hypothetical protein
MNPLQQLLENYYRGYISLTLTGDSALPATTALPILCAHDRAPAKFPMIALTMDDTEDDLSTLPRLDVVIRLCIEARPEDDNPNPAGTAIEDALAWVKAIQLRVNDDEAFRTYLLSLDEADRTGAEIVSRDPSQRAEFGHSAEDNADTWTITISHWVNLDPD